MAAQAKQMGRTVTLEPMPPNERRIIHMALQDDGTVRTESTGEGERRKVTIVPVNPTQT
jgi:spoIIIJ-associated protein